MANFESDERGTCPDCEEEEEELCISCGMCKDCCVCDGLEVEEDDVEEEELEEDDDDNLEDPL